MSRGFASGTALKRDAAYVRDLGVDGSNGVLGRSDGAVRLTLRYDHARGLAEAAGKRKGP